MFFSTKGEMNASMSVLENPATEKDQVQKIWEDVGVGKDGFLDMDELAIVCEHIGMEDMDKEVRGTALVYYQDWSQIHSHSRCSYICDTNFINNISRMVAYAKIIPEMEMLHNFWKSVL